MVYDVFSEVWVSMCDVYALETLDKSPTSFCNWGQQMSKNMHGQMKWSMDNRQDDACEIFFEGSEPKTLLVWLEVFAT
jgi:hypothetical protein